MSFIFNGVSSDTMKFNVTSRQVYNAPAYDLNAIEVPGRSGDLLNPQNRFKNKQVSYTGFLKASDFEGSTWREKLSTGLIQLKGWLCSDAGNYHELTDDYDPGFTRYGYISGETAISDVQDRPFGVTLTVTFNCKPYMYKAGEPMELPETKSASGSIITITDGAENTPLKSAVVNIEPAQDLHGYDFPWPAGGGKNILDVSMLQQGNYDGNYPGTNVNTSEYIPIKPSTTYMWSQNASTNGRYARFYTSDKTLLADDNISQPNTKNATFTTPATAAYMRIMWYKSVGLLIDDVVALQPQIEEGSVATAWTPYSNICPISGWSEANVVAAGGNLLPNKFYQDGANTVVLGQERSANAGQDVFLKAGTYHIDVVASKTASLFYKRSGEDTVRITTSSLSGTFTLTKDGNYAFWAYAGTGITVADITSAQISVGSTASPYAAPTITPITIPLGRTVYGGTLDVLNGKLSVTEALLTLNTANMNNSEAFPGWVNSGVRQYVGAGINAVYNSMLNVGNTFSVNTTLTYDILYLSAQSYGKTQTEWKALAIDVQMIVPLATPLEYDVTPHTIKTLKGTNNFWADAGEMSIEYPIPTENPYPFGSRPLYEITMAGTGTLVVNGREWTITGYIGTLYCDTEAMEWYDASQLRNNIVSGDGWPVFEAGENSVSYTGDITKVMVTPRWRTL